MTNAIETGARRGAARETNRSGGRRAVTHLLGVLGIAALLIGALAPHAGAAVTERHPTAVQSEVATGLQGWTSATSPGGLCLVPGVTCPAITANHGTANGAGGTADGYLHTGAATLVGLLSTGEAVWTSPSFTVPAAVSSASLQFDRRANLASLLSLGGAATSSYYLVNTTTGVRTPIAQAVPVTASTAWTSVNAGAIPASALLPGNAYRLELRALYSTPVSVATSGEIDFDRVRLVTSRLTPPRALTAPSVQIDSDGVRVVGSLDTQGLETTVHAEYGPTAGYGSETPSQLVAGSGYTIPLAGLTPGDEYHVRVTAVSGDGTASSSDVTFTAPPLPPNGPPIVDGAPNDRARTVTFDRPASVLSATIEILDAGSTVVGSVPVGSGDSATITLPDADGSYGIRVRRTTGSGSTTSAATTAILDRQGPSTTGLNLDVQPRVSALRARRLSFERPGDALTIQAEIVDALGDPVGPAAAVDGGVADLTLPATDGLYRVRLSLTDAAGNTSTILGPPLTLDRQAPDAGPAPIVTGAPNTRLRTAEFTRDPDTAWALIEVLEAGGNVVTTALVPAGNTASVTLPQGDGTYRLRVLQADASGNESRSPSTTVLLDQTSPDPGGAPSVTGPDDSRSRAVLFSRAPDAATASIEILSGAAGVPIDTIAVPSGASASITLPDADGPYRVRVRQTDASGNDSITPETAVTLDRGAPDAGAAPAVVGAASSRSRTAHFDRDPAAATVTIEITDAGGLVVDTIAVPTGSSGSFTLAGADGTYGVRIRQTDAGGNSAVSPSTTVTLDTEAPSAGDPPSIAGDADALEVTFDRPADAATATVRITDEAGNTVATIVVPTESSVQTALPSAHGTYRVAVTYADLAGNESTTQWALALRLALAPPDPAPTTPASTPELPAVEEPSGVNAQGISGSPRPTTPSGVPSNLDAWSGTPPAGDRTSAGYALASCNGSGLTLSRLRISGGRVRVYGVGRYAKGVPVVIRDRAGQALATTKLDGQGRFRVSFPAGDLPGPLASTKLYAQSYSVRSRSLRLSRANDLTGVSVKGRTVTLTGTLSPAYRKGRVRFDVFGGHRLAGCGGNKTLAATGPARFDSETGRYTLTVRAPAGTGPLLVRVRASSSVRGKTFSVFAVR